MTQTVTFTKAERETIDSAFRDIEYLCSITNWTDSPQFVKACKLSRKDSDSRTEMQGRMVKAWIAGARAIDSDCPISNYPFGYTESYRLMFDLGATQALKHSGPNRSDYTGPRYDKARQSGPDAIAAFDAAMGRWHAIPESTRRFVVSFLES